MNNWLKFNQLLNYEHLTNRIFKQHCLLCSASTNNNLCICSTCIANLVIAPSPCCPQCGLETKGEVCGKCIRQPPYYDHTKALFSYAFPIDALLQHYKYRNTLYLSKTLGLLLSEVILKIDVDFIIAMPLHMERLKSRGFNQSLEVAKIVAKKINIPIKTDICHKIKNTLPQASLPVKERRKNMLGAFKINEKLDNDLINNKRIAIIDDVMTTGASLNELAKTLKKGGAKQVECWVIARTL